MAHPNTISPHPSPSIISEDELSTPASDATEFANLFAEAKHLLGRYPPAGPNDHTRDVLRAALEYLPMDGRLNLMREMVRFGEDWANLRRLGLFFIDAVLKPSMLSQFKRIYNKTAANFK